MGHSEYILPSVKFKILLISPEILLNEFDSKFTQLSHTLLYRRIHSVTQKEGSEWNFI